MKSQFALLQAPGALARALRRAILLAIAVGLVAAPAAGAVTYPQAGGNGFDADAQGWTGVTATCTPTVGSLCTETNFHSVSEGNPPGSIESRMDVVLNAGDLFAAQATWRSPSFVATANGSAAFSYDRQLDASGLASLQPSTTVESVLVDESTGQAQSLDSEMLGLFNTTFSGHTVYLPAETLSLGNRYHLELRSATTTNAAIVGVTGSASVRFDNVALAVRNTGPGGASGSDGVRFVRQPISLREFRKLARKVNWAANRGRLAGGSVVPLKDCTIIGTSHADHIHGSSGNDVICGLGGNDTINGAGGHDIIDGGSGNDRLNGSASGDVIAGLAGHDRVRGGAGRDRAGGGAANDTLSGGPRRDRVNGGAGIDRAVRARHDRVTRVERGG